MRRPPFPLRFLRQASPRRQVCRQPSLHKLLRRPRRQNKAVIRRSVSMDAAVAKLRNLLAWGIPGRGATKIFGFALMEHANMLDLHAAAVLTESPERRAAYLQHMLDEARHARMFVARAVELRLEAALPSLGFPIADSQNLFETLGELRFLAFVHRGEVRASRQLRTYAELYREQGDGESSAMLAAVAEAEHRHEQYANDLLTKLAGPKQARAEVRAVIAWEAWRTWRRMGMAVAGLAYYLSMLAVYFVLGPLAAALTRGQARRNNWST
jgi:hypothetical protein